MTKNKIRLIIPSIYFLGCLYSYFFGLEKIPCMVLASFMTAQILWYELPLLCDRLFGP